MERSATLQSAVGELERLQIRLTPQKYAVLEQLHLAVEQPTVEELCRLLTPRFPRLNATAVRNTVLVFEKMGLLPEQRKDRQAG